MRLRLSTWLCFADIVDTTIDDDTGIEDEQTFDDFFILALAAAFQQAAKVNLGLTVDGHADAKK